MGCQRPRYTGVSTVTLVCALLVSQDICCFGQITHDTSSVDAAVDVDVVVVVVDVDVVEDTNGRFGLCPLRLGVDCAAAIVYLCYCLSAAYASISECYRGKSG